MSFFNVYTWKVWCWNDWVQWHQCEWVVMRSYIVAAVWKRTHCSCSQHLHFQSASTIYSWYLSTKSTNVFFVLAACKTSYARGLKHIQLAPYNNLHNQSVSISGPFLDLTQAWTTQKAWKTKLTNTNLPRVAKSISFCCSLKGILVRQLITFPKPDYCNIFCNCESSRGLHAEFSRVACCAGLIFNMIQ